jgi:hypothetical protein
VVSDWWVLNWQAGSLCSDWLPASCSGQGRCAWTRRGTRSSLTRPGWPGTGATTASAAFSGPSVPSQYNSFVKNQLNISN